jgi:hypothetical protein
MVRDLADIRPGNDKAIICLTRPQALVYVAIGLGYSVVCDRGRWEMKADARQRWYGFLEEESRRENGLFCFYEPVRSQEVDHWCGVLADSLAGFLNGDGESGPSGD